MADIFADTSGLGNLFDTAQPRHQATVEIYRDARRNRRKLITTNYVITELAALLTSPLRIPRPTVIRLIEGLKSSPFVEVVYVDVALDAKAWDLFRRHRDKTWSWVDCASFALMAERNLTEALATDHHFEQAGFVLMTEPD